MPPARPDLLAQAILRVLGDEKLTTRIAAQGEERARTVYGPETHARRVAQVYRELLDG